MRDEDMDSERTALESRILWKRVNAAAVRRLEASVAAESVGERRFFWVSSSLRKSDIFVSSS